MSQFNQSAVADSFLGGFNAGRGMMEAVDSRDERRRRHALALQQLALEERQQTSLEGFRQQGMDLDWAKLGQDASQFGQLMDYRHQGLDLDYAKLGQDASQFGQMMDYRNAGMDLDRERLDIQREGAALDAKRVNLSEQDLNFQIDKWLRGDAMRTDTSRALTDFARTNELFGPDPGNMGPGGFGPPTPYGGVYGSMLKADPDLIRGILPHMIDLRQQTVKQAAHQQALDAAAQRLLIGLESIKAKDPEGYANGVARVEAWRMTAALPNVDALPNLGISGMGGGKETIAEVNALRGQFTALSTSLTQAMKLAADPMADEETVAAAKAHAAAIGPMLQQVQQQMAALNASMAAPGRAAPAGPAGPQMAPTPQPAPYGPPAAPPMDPGNIPGVTVPAGRPSAGLPSPSPSPSAPPAGPGGPSPTGLTREALAQKYTPEQAAKLAREILGQTIDAYAQQAAFSRSFDLNAVPAEIRELVRERAMDLQAAHSGAGGGR